MYNFTYPIICMGKLRLILPGSFPGAGEPGLNPPRVLGYAWVSLGDLRNEKQGNTHMPYQRHFWPPTKTRLKKRQKKDLAKWAGIKEHGKPTDRKRGQNQRVRQQQLHELHTSRGFWYEPAWQKSRLSPSCTEYFLPFLTARQPSS